MRTSWRCAAWAAAAYSDLVNPRARRLIVSGVLVGLVVIVVLAAVWNAAS